jgi:hypothetical protein
MNTSYIMYSSGYKLLPTMSARVTRQRIISASPLSNWPNVSRGFPQTASLFLPVLEGGYPLAS